MKIIKLTYAEAGNPPVYINIDLIKSFSQILLKEGEETKCTLIHWLFNSRLRVLETPEEILKLLKKYDDNIMKIIKLTYAETGDPVYINIDSIKSFNQILLKEGEETKCTLIRYLFNDMVKVLETQEEILKLLKYEEE